MNTPMHVSELWIYPVKSLGGLKVTESAVLPKGLQYDRRWMLVDTNGRFLTQREWPQLALFSINAGNNGLAVTFGSKEIELPYNSHGSRLQAIIWNDEVEVLQVSDAHNRWFSEALDTECGLVFFPEKSTRAVDPDYGRAGDQTSLSDGYPVLVIGQSSLDDLNSRLVAPVPMNRFRPNMVISGSLPFEEDQWRQFTIGNLAFEGVKPCARCVMTTIDQQTGLAGKEPLATLSGYRKVGNKVLFGQNVIPRQSGTVRVGDVVRVVS
jgi:uncharacterized protein YcbX